MFPSDEISLALNDDKKSFIDVGEFVFDVEGSDVVAFDGLSFAGAAAIVTGVCFDAEEVLPGV